MDKNADSMSVHSKASMTPSQRVEALERKAIEDEQKRHDEEIAKIRSGYQSILNTKKPHKSTIVGLNPNQRPDYKQSTKNMFPMQGLWSDKHLMKTTNQVNGVSLSDQQSQVDSTNKEHFKVMYKQKEYMEEYLKYKDVISGMKK